MIPQATLDKHAHRLTPASGDTEDQLWAKAFDFTNACCFDHRESYALITKAAGRRCGPGRDCDKIVERATGFFYDMVAAAGSTSQRPSNAQQDGFVPVTMRADPEPYEGSGPAPVPIPTPVPCRNPDRGEMMNAGERLDAYYRSPEGLQRPHGAATVDGTPDWEAVGAWLFDVYLQDRQAGKSADDAWANVESQIRQSSEWQMKHPGEQP